MSRTLRTFESVDALNRAAAEVFAECATAAVRTSGRFTVALAGGSTPRRLYTLLGGDPDPRFRDAIPWPRVEVFWGDERTVPPDDKDSNFRMTREALLSRVPIAADRIHRIRGEAPDPDAAAAEYEAALRSIFGSAGAAFPRFDLVILGMGADGHTASLFPGTTAVDEQHKWVAALWVEKLSTHRITLTFPVLNHAARVLFLIAGADKAATLSTLLHDPANAAGFPAARVQPIDGELLWFVDRAALPASGA